MYPILVLISGNGSNLQAIIDASKQGAAYHIAAVISNKPDAYGLTRAKQANIPTEVLLSKQFVNRIEYDKALAQIINRYKPKLIVLAGFMRILSAEFIQQFKNQIINIHPSLLPKYPGLDTHQRVLAERDQAHGATVHYVIEELDAGPIIAQSSVPVYPTDTSVSLQQRVHLVEYKLYPTVIEWIAEGRLLLQQDGVYLDAQLLPKEGFRFISSD